MIDEERKPWQGSLKNILKRLEASAPLSLKAPLPALQLLEN